MSDQRLRIVFMGTPDFAAPILRSLLQGPDQVVAVVSQPDRAKGRGKKVSPTPTKLVAEASGLPVLQPEKIRTEEFRNGLLSYAPDLIVVAAYGRILPKSLLQLAPLGCINVHGSLLPAYRGAAPVQWALICGEDEVGVTIMQMNEGMDTGDMLLQAKMTPDVEETAGSLMPKLAELGGAALLRTIAGLKDGSIVALPQDHAQATMAPLLTKEDGCIDWSKSAEELHCLVRGLDPWPSAYTFADGIRLRLFAPEVVFQASDAAPGTVLRADGRGLLVACGKHCLNLREVQPEGKKRMSVASFSCGNPLPTGTLLQGPGETDER
jgi:methionyl-tRNA formyltransferase